MKNVNNYLGLEMSARLSKPVFREVTVSGSIFNKETGEEEYGERHITLCQVTAIVDDIFTGEGVISTIGVSIKNPEDEDNELGENISFGRAIKNPIANVSLTSARKLPKPIIEEQLTWAEKQVERNLNDYVNNLRETLKNG